MSKLTRRDFTTTGQPASKTGLVSHLSGELQKPWGKMELGTLNLKNGQTQVVLNTT